MPKRVLVPLAVGFEELEAVAVIDILRRAGAEVVVAGLADRGPVTGRSSVAVLPDTDLDSALAGGSFDAIVLPGGMDGTLALRDDPRISAALVDAADRGALTAAICAAPLVLERAGLLAGRPFTSHPGVAADFAGGAYREDRVVISENVVTSRAPGTAVEFALELARLLCGRGAADRVAAEILASRPQTAPAG
ncbi:MAG TPA: DJ-1 family glyoxalase III [Polyangia bacterium]|nr:DJ-1 family glyoxalase III [Polyangia bacterium]